MAPQPQLPEASEFTSLSGASDLTGDRMETPFQTVASWYYNTLGQSGIPS